VFLRDGVVQRGLQVRNAPLSTAAPRANWGVGSAAGAGCQATGQGRRRACQPQRPTRWGWRAGVSRPRAARAAHGATRSACSPPAALPHTSPNSPWRGGRW